MGGKKQSGSRTGGHKFTVATKKIGNVLPQPGQQFYVTISICGGKHFTVNDVHGRKFSAIMRGKFVKNRRQNTITSGCIILGEIPEDWGSKTKPVVQLVYVYDNTEVQSLMTLPEYGATVCGLVAMSENL